MKQIKNISTNCFDIWHIFKPLSENSWSYARWSPTTAYQCIAEMLPRDSPLPTQSHSPGGFFDCKDAFDTNDDADWIFFDDGQNIDTLIIYILMMMGDVDIVMMLAADTVDDDTL